MVVIAVVNRAEAPPEGDPFMQLALVDRADGVSQNASLYAMAHLRVARNILTSFRSEPPALLELFQRLDDDPDTAIRRTARNRSLAAATIAGVLGRRRIRGARTAVAAKDEAASKLLNDVVSTAGAACEHDAGHTRSGVQNIQHDAATRLVTVPASAPQGSRQCGPALFAFKGLRLSFSGPPKADGSRTAYAASSIAGSVCGDASRDAWEVSFAYTGTSTRHVHPTFATANPFTIHTHSFHDGSAISIKLRYASGAAPQMKVQAESKGKVSNVLAKPAQAAVTVTHPSTC